MTDRPVFLLGQPKTATDDPNQPYPAVGFAQNPFPPSGVQSDVLFTNHMPEALGQINDWLQEAQSLAAEHRPLAVRGSLGVGKTHLLASLERGLQRQGFSVLRRQLSEKGLSRLLLADLLLPEATTTASAERTNTPAEWLFKLFQLARSEPHRLDSPLAELRRDSLVAMLFRQIVTRPDDIQAEWLLRWFSRSHLSEGRLQKLGVNGPLHGEGESLRALSELARLAVGTGVVPGPWFIFLDQLEDLFRPGNMSDARRARFLTDLRSLIDLSLEGAPLAILVAWNTEVGVQLEHKIETEYRALWTRLKTLVDLPQLKREHVQPFGKAYLDHALEDAAIVRDKNRADAFVKKLLASANRVLAYPQVAQSLRSLEQVSLRDALDAWRQVAREIAEER